MTLFGRRQQQQQQQQQKHVDNTRTPPLPTVAGQSPKTGIVEMVAVSAGLSLLAALSEEVAFRAALPTALGYLCHSPTALLPLQALLFGHSHISPTASRGENKVVCATQTLHGLWLGGICLLSGGNLVPSIVAHALYDHHVFVKTWMEVNDQMDYTEGSVRSKLSPAEVDALRAFRDETGPGLTAEALASTRRLYFAFDTEHQGALSEYDVQRAVSYAFLRDETSPSQERVGRLFHQILRLRSHTGQPTYSDTPCLEDSTVKGDRLSLAEFLRLLFVLKTNPTPTQPLQSTRTC